MLVGLRNLLKAGKRADVTRFIHLSSVAVYGDPPPLESETEHTPQTKPQKGSFGWIKPQQDYLVEKAAGVGLPSLALCPPNIIGPYSVYLIEILEAIRLGRFAMIDEGSSVCNTVDATNLCHAIFLSLEKGHVDGTRLFITDGDRVTWRDVVDQLSPLLPKMPSLLEIDRCDIEGILTADVKKRVSLWAAAKHLVSSDVREALRKDPLLAAVDRWLRGGVAKLDARMEENLRLSIEGALPIPEAASHQSPDPRLCLQQTRGVHHSCSRARRVLGYEPLVTFKESMKAFRAWYRDFHGWNTGVGDLLQAENRELARVAATQT